MLDKLIGSSIITIALVVISAIGVTAFLGLKANPAMQSLKSTEQVTPRIGQYMGSLVEYGSLTKVKDEGNTCYIVNYASSVSISCVKD